MKLDEAIKIALSYEAGVYGVYVEAMDKIADPAAKRILKVLCEEEMGHRKYLEARFEEWQRMGKVTATMLDTSIPTREKIEKGLQDLRTTVKAKPTKQILELELLKKALDAEMKSTAFYKEMVAILDGEGQALFKRFVEIEEGHETIVRAEINTVGNWGFWFDIPEFRLEME
jgi:rubrerythrin